MEIEEVRQIEIRAYFRGCLRAIWKQNPHISQLDLAAQTHRLAHEDGFMTEYEARQCSEYFFGS